MYVLLFPFVKITRGYTRAVIANLRDNFYMHIPNSLAGLFTEGWADESIIATLDQEDAQTVQEYFRFLLERKLAYRGDTLPAYEQWKEPYQSPGAVEQAILDYMPGSPYNLQEAIAETDALGCAHLQLRFYGDIHYARIEELLPVLNNSSFTSIELVLPYRAGILANKRLLSQLVTNRRFVATFYAAPRNKRIHNAAFTSQPVVNEHACGIIAQKNFSLAVSTYRLSQSYNTCLYKKIAIDRNGYIKACPSQQLHYGLYQRGLLHETLPAVTSHSITSIHKEMIAVCKDCEYRHICTDCRAYLSQPDDLHSKPLKCGYNPYTATWSQWDADPANEPAIRFYALQDIL